MYKISNEDLISKSITDTSIRVVVCNDVVKEGVDFKNVRQIHILEPWYNESKLTQIIGRGVRMFSHATLDQDEQNITIFKHCCIHEAKKDQKTKKNQKTSESYDYYAYKKSQQNLNIIKKIEEILQSNSIDCNLNKSQGEKTVEKIQRNMLGEEIKFSVPVSENMCTQNELKLNGSDLNTVEYDVETTIYKIQKYFRNKNLLHVSVNTLKEDINQSGILSNLFDLALSKLLRDKVKFSIQGKEGRLAKSRDHVIFVDSNVDYPIITKTQLKFHRERKIKRKKITEIQLLPRKIDKTVENVLKQIEERHNELRKNIGYHVNNVDDKILYSMILHRLNKEDSEAFIKESLNDTNERLKDIEENIENDIIIKLKDNDREIKYVVNIPNRNFKFKSDGRIIEARLTDVSTLVDILKREEKFPKYYRKFNNNNNKNDLYLLKSSEQRRPANAASNQEGQLDNIVTVARNFKPDENIFKKTFKKIEPNEIEQDKKQYYSKANFLDVLEYSARYYGHYVHPMTLAE